MNQKHFSFINRTVVALLCLFTGCATNPRGQVYRDWATSFAELGIYPIFPAREDILVGDIYLLPMHPLNTYMIGKMGGLGMTGIHLGYSDWNNPGGETQLTDTLEKYYRERPTFADGPAGTSIPSLTNAADSMKTSATNAGPNSVDQDGRAKTNSPSMDRSPTSTTEDIPKLPKAPEDARTNIFAALEPVRLKEVAFPEFAFTTINEASAAAAVPIEGVLVNGGVDVSKVSRIAVKIPMAESYGLPVTTLLRKFFLKDVWQDTNNGTWYLRADPTPENDNALIRPAGEMARSMFTRSLETAIRDNYPAWKHLITNYRLKWRVDQDADSLYLALISEVFYTRSIDLTVTTTSAFAGAASAAPVGAEQVQQWMSLAKNATNSTTTTTNSSAISTNTASAQSNTVTTVAQTISTSGAAANSDPFVVAERLRNLKLGYTNGIGGSVRVVAVSGHTVALQRTFEHPIAVGVRGVVMRIQATATKLQTNSMRQFLDTPTPTQSNTPTMGYRIEVYERKPPH